MIPKIIIAMTMRRIKRLGLKRIAFGALAGLLAPALANAQYFDYSTTTTGQGALLAGFRKPGLDSYELVVNLGNITNFLAVPAGTTIPITAYAPANVAAAFTDNNELKWAAFATVNGAPNSSWAGFRVNTIWYTVPRDNFATPANAPKRYGSTGQGLVNAAVDSIGRGARTASLRLAITDSNNTTNRVREQLPEDSSWSLSYFIGNPQNTSYGDFGGYLPVNAEYTTPASFTTAVRSDLYQSVPNNVLDPISGQTTGAAYHVGYFTLAPDGSLTFTRAATTVTPPPPAPEIVNVTRSGDTSTVTFTTAAGSYTYSLHYTNAAGLAAPIADWPVAGATVTGDGANKQLSDTTTDEARFYRVSAH